MVTTLNTSRRFLFSGQPAERVRNSSSSPSAGRHRVSAFFRNPRKLGGPREGLMVIEGDLLKPGAIGAALAGHDAILSAIAVWAGTVDDNERLRTSGGDGNGNRRHTSPGYCRRCDALRR